jgi:hypothetical protein
VYEKHFVRHEFTVRVGGWKLGRLRFGGGRYTVRPFSVRDVFAIQSSLGRLKLPPGMDAIQAASLDPFGILRPFVRFAVEERVDPRHLARMTEAQFNVVVAAVREANDVDYLVKSLIPTEETAERKTDPLSFILAVIAAEHGARNETEVANMPMQLALAILDASRGESGDGMGIEKATELEAANIACGFVVN